VRPFFIAYALLRISFFLRMDALLRVRTVIEMKVFYPKSTIDF
jgi:hypothetical protein